MKRPYIIGLIVLFAGTLLLFVPVLGEFHLFSAMVAGILGCIWAAISAASTNFANKPESGLKSAGIISGFIFLSGIPLLISALFRGCFSSQGLLFWLLIPVPSVLLGYATGRFFSINRYRYPKTLSILTLFVIGIVGFVAEFYSFPQTYFFNHLWGYFPGPIYDDSITVSDSLIIFRYMTLCWILLLWLIPHIKQEIYLKVIAGLSFFSLLLCYMNLPALGIISPEPHIQRELGAAKQTDHFIFYFDRRIPEKEIEYLAELHEFHVRELAELLQIEIETWPPIRSYVYHNPWQKKSLTGAGQTSYVPVWHRNPQLHTHRQVTAAIVRHELVHVLGREFSHPLIGASPNMALTEGLATALESPRNPISTRDEIVAGLDSIPSTREMNQLMSPFGFYRLHGSVSYTLAASFVAWLLENHPVEYFKQAYRSGSLGRVFRETGTDMLFNEWRNHISTIETSDEQQVLSERIFSLPGITEVKCPFIADADTRTLDDARRLLALRDSTATFDLLDNRVQQKQTTRRNLLSLWAELGLQTGKFDEIIHGIGERDDIPHFLTLRLADAFFLQGDLESAKYIIKNLKNDDVEIGFRKDAEPWETGLTILYTNAVLSQNEVPTSLIPSYLRRVIRSGSIEHLAGWSPDEDFPISSDALVIYLQTIDWFLKNRNTEKAQEWLDFLEIHFDSGNTAEMIYERARFMNYLLRE